MLYANSSSLDKHSQIVRLGPSFFIDDDVLVFYVYFNII